MSDLDGSSSCVSDTSHARRKHRRRRRNKRLGRKKRKRRRRHSVAQANLVPAKQLEVYCVPVNRKTKGLVASVGGAAPRTTVSSAVIKKNIPKGLSFIVDDLARRADVSSCCDSGKLFLQAGGNNSLVNMLVSQATSVDDLERFLDPRNFRHRLYFSYAVQSPQDGRRARGSLPSASTAIVARVRCVACGYHSHFGLLRSAPASSVCTWV